MGRPAARGDNGPVANDIERIGGEEKRKIVIVAYDPSWPDRFKTQRSKKMVP